MKNIKNLVLVISNKERAYSQREQIINIKLTELSEDSLTTAFKALKGVKLWDVAYSINDITKPMSIQLLEIFGETEKMFWKVVNKFRKV